jgi:hypothetical protein
MGTKKENEKIEDAAVVDPQNPESTPTCPFCTTTLSLLHNDGAAAKYECPNVDCVVGYSRCIINCDGSTGGFETAHHPDKDALVQVVDYGGACAVYTRQSGDEEGRSRIPIGLRCTLKDVFDNIDYWLPYSARLNEG